ncbi:hypothetical protein AADZ91_18255 [Colwelliaceae bacterium 6441]
MSSPSIFKDHVRKTFSFLIDSYDYQEQALDKLENEYSVKFISAKTKIVVEGINWGINSRVAVGSSKGKFENYDLGDVLTVFCPERSLKDSNYEKSQIEQLSIMAFLLKDCAEQILLNDHSSFPKLAKIVKKRAKEFSRL